MLLEIRPGEGGDDAVHFAEQLKTALTSYVSKLGKPIQVRSTDRIIVLDVGENGKCLEFATGVHRIQRIPSNDRKGRRHTSTATVALVGSVNSPKVEIRKEDCIEDTYRSDGPGGQHRNKTDTAVRITHVPSGVTVCAEDSKSQWQNRQNAYSKLRDKLQTELIEASVVEQQRERIGQISTGERSVKQFTWNDQRGEVIDHSTGDRWLMKDALKGKF